LGISLTKHKDSGGRQFVTYKEALALNGHDMNTDIHYLKIDTEESEYEVRFQHFNMIKEKFDSN